MREIKRYANRKLYDTQESRYITLDEIAVLIQGGEDVKIIDNRSGDDISRQTLAQIILKQEKRRQGTSLPLSTLRELIQKGGSTLQDAFSKGSKPLREFYSQVGGGLEKFLHGLIERGVVSEEEGRSLIKGLVQRAEKGKESLEAKVDERIARTLEKLNIPSVDEVDALQRKLDELIRLIDELTAGKGGKR